MHWQPNGADIGIPFVVVDKVGFLKDAIRPLRSVKNRNMRKNAFLVYKPVEVLGCSVGRICNQYFRVEVEGLARSLDHGACCTNFRLAD